MGRELAEGKVHAIERQAALAKAFAEDTRKVLEELEDHVHSLDAENEELQVRPEPPAPPLGRRPVTQVCVDTPSA